MFRRRGWENQIVVMAVFKEIEQGADIGVTLDDVAFEPGVLVGIFIGG